MKKFELENYTGGWIVGDFVPNIIQTTDIEIGIKTYSKGFTDKPHYHKKTTEYTIILKGKAEICGIEINEGTIVRIDPLEVANFKALTDLITLVIKTPSLPKDKFFSDEE